MESGSRRLKADAIVEALFEMRFHTSCLEEIVISKLLSKPELRSSDVTRLPLAELPSIIRQQEPGLAYAPSLELKCAGGAYKVKIGARVVSLHVHSPYPGGEEFKRLINDLAQFLYAEFPDIRMDRLGFRYVNLVREGLHLITKPSDLKVNLTVSGHDFTDDAMITVREKRSGEHEITTKIASKGYIGGNLPPDTILAIDVDVSTGKNTTIADQASLKQWVEQAHLLEKEKFFSLFPGKLLEQLWAD